MKQHSRRNTLAGMLIGILIGSAVTASIWASSDGTAIVRIVGRVLDDGSVEVRIQERVLSLDQQVDAGEQVEWGDAIAPSARFLPADAEPNRWYSSSAVEIAIRDPAPPTIGEIGPFRIAGTPTSSRPFDDQTLLCVITHGVQQDFFWFQVYSALLDAERWNDVRLRAEMYEHSHDQAAGITGCVNDGAAAIATTLADPEALQPALDAAYAAGVRIVTFNSGAAHATDVGSIAHVSLDEEAVGRIAAERFIQEDVNGDLLCVIHEPSNQGLEARCDALEATYDRGSVVRLRISESEDPVAAIASQVTGNIGGAIALNAGTAYELADAISADHPDVVLAAVAADFPSPLAMLYSGRLSFVLWSHALEQGYFTTMALLYGHGTPFPRETGLFAETTQISIHPTVIDPETVRALVDADNLFGSTLPAWLNALKQAIEREPLREQ